MARIGRFLVPSFDTGRMRADDWRCGRDEPHRYALGVATIVLGAGQNLVPSLGYPMGSTFVIRVTVNMFDTYISTVFIANSI